jgi:hypothetical protein
MKNQVLLIDVKGASPGISIQAIDVYAESIAVIENEI